jgi:nitroimidazol reductase NimA-like FMN-containing flavoprotein (pyridoxamine 5'-phosphate oxidase superfamily)
MPGPLNPHEREAFLAEPHIAVLSVANVDGRPPLTAPTWYHFQPGGPITFFTGTQGRKARKAELIAGAGVVSLCVQRETFPYRYVVVEGTVVRTDRPPAAEQALAIVRRYLPEEQAHGFVAGELDHPTGEFVMFTVRPDRWFSLDFGEDES